MRHLGLSTVASFILSFSFSFLFCAYRPEFPTTLLPFGFLAHPMNIHPILVEAFCTLPSSGQELKFFLFFLEDFHFLFIGMRLSGRRVRVKSLASKLHYTVVSLLP